MMKKVVIILGVVIVILATLLFTLDRVEAPETETETETETDVQTQDHVATNLLVCPSGDEIMMSFSGANYNEATMELGGETYELTRSSEADYVSADGSVVYRESQGTAMVEMDGQVIHKDCERKENGDETVDEEDEDSATSTN